MSDITIKVHMEDNDNLTGEVIVHDEASLAEFEIFMMLAKGVVLLTHKAASMSGKDEGKYREFLGMVDDIRRTANPSPTFVHDDEDGAVFETRMAVVLSARDVQIDEEVGANGIVPAKRIREHDIQIHFAKDMKAKEAMESLAIVAAECFDRAGPELAKNDLVRDRFKRIMLTAVDGIPYRDERPMPPIPVSDKPRKPGDGPPPNLIGQVPKTEDDWRRYWTEAKRQGYELPEKWKGKL